MRNEPYMTPTECSRYYNIGRDTVYRYHRSGKLRFMRIGVRTFVDMESADQCFNKKPVVVEAKDQVARGVGVAA
jgi:excisionase family DNA binding protein